jgi:hypothetical protein
MAAGLAAAVALGDVEVDAAAAGDEAAAFDAAAFDAAALDAAVLDPVALDAAGADALAAVDAGALKGDAVEWLDVHAASSVALARPTERMPMRPCEAVMASSLPL